MNKVLFLSFFHFLPHSTVNYSHGSQGFIDDGEYLPTPSFWALLGGFGEQVLGTGDREGHLKCAFIVDFLTYTSAITKEEHSLSNCHPFSLDCRMKQVE